MSEQAAVVISAGRFSTAELVKLETSVFKGSESLDPSFGWDDGLFRASLADELRSMRHQCKRWHPALPLQNAEQGRVPIG